MEKTEPVCRRQIEVHYYSIATCRVRSKILVSDKKEELPTIFWSRGLQRLKARRRRSNLSSPISALEPVSIVCVNRRVLFAFNLKWILHQPWHIALNLQCVTQCAIRSPIPVSGLLYKETFGNLIQIGDQVAVDSDYTGLQISSLNPQE